MHDLNLTDLRREKNQSERNDTYYFHWHGIYTCINLLWVSGIMSEKIILPQMELGYTLTMPHYQRFGN